MPRDGAPGSGRDPHFLEAFEARLQTCVAAFSDSDNTGLMEVVSYALSGGKRVRPLLFASAYALFGERVEEEEALLDWAVALEMIHAYSLVHDDLPGMDNDRFRRGKLTAHAKYGEAMAILAGDSLLNMAMELSSQNLCTLMREDPSAQRDCLALLFHLSGPQGMIGGQHMDLTMSGQENRAFLDRMVQKKTSALFQAACAMGVLLAGGSEAQKDTIMIFAEEIGRAYQMKDDLFDRGQDADSHKISYASQWAEKDLEAEIARLSHQAIERLEAFPHPQRLRALAEALVHRTY